MLIADVILLALVLSLAGWRMVAPAWRPRARLIGIGLAFILASIQWALWGYTWQNLPAFLLLALCALPSVRTGIVWRRIGRLGLFGVAAMCIGVWILPAVPTLPQPDGPYALGTQIYRWTDPSRVEPHTADLNDHRSVIAQVWYPADQREPSEGITRLPYIDGIGSMPRYVSAMPSFLMRRYNQIDTHAEPLAPLLPSAESWPVVIFSPGYGAPRAVYTGLATQLASRGLVVFVLDHPFESAVSELPGGEVVGTEEILLPGESDLTPYMVRQQDVRTADVRFVIDQLSRSEALAPSLRSDRIEGSRVAVIGHSFGGAAALATSSEDSRVVAAANIDGTPYGDLSDRQLSRPVLLVQSDYAETRHSELFLNGNGKLLACASAASFRFEIKRANHYSFTDAPFFFAPPGRWLLAQLIGGERGPQATQQATADILEAFLSGPLKGAAADLSAMAASDEGVLGGVAQRNANCGQVVER